MRQLRGGVDVRGNQIRLARLLQCLGRAEQVVQQVVHDVVQHDRDDDLVRAGARLEGTDQPAHDGAAREPADQADDGVHHERQADREAQVGRHDRAADPLAGGADVEQAGPERQRDRETGQDQRRGLERRLRERVENRPDRAAVERRADRVRVKDRALEHRGVGRGDGLPGGVDGGARVREEAAPLVQDAGVAERDEQTAEYQGEDDRQDGDDGGLPCEIASQSARSQRRGGGGAVAVVELSGSAPEGCGSGGCGSGGTPLASSLTSPPLRPRARRRARQDRDPG